MKLLTKTRRLQDSIETLRLDLQQAEASLERLQSQVGATPADEAQQGLILAAFNRVRMTELDIEAKKRQLERAIADEQSAESREQCRKAVACREKAKKLFASDVPAAAKAVDAAFDALAQACAALDGALKDAENHFFRYQETAINVPIDAHVENFYMSLSARVQSVRQNIEPAMAERLDKATRPLTGTSVAARYVDDYKNPATIERAVTSVLKAQIPLAFREVDRATDIDARAA